MHRRLRPGRRLLSVTGGGRFRTSEETYGDDAPVHQLVDDVDELVLVLYDRSAGEE